MSCAGESGPSRVARPFVHARAVPTLQLAGLMLALLAAAPLQAQTLKPGDLAFTTYNADQDGWALVALVDLAPQTNVFFTDNAWNGSSAFAAGGGFERWVSGSGKISAGTVVQFSYIDDAWKMQASVGTLSRETVAGSSSLNLSQTVGTLYAYQGASAIQPSVFITAVSNGGFGAEVGSLVGTGLVAGATALQLTQGVDFSEFAGARTARLSVDNYRSLLNDVSNWSAADGGQYALQLSNAAPLASLVVPEPSALLLALAGALTLAATRRGAQVSVAPPSP
jgi:hypothetical protein